MIKTTRNKLMRPSFQLLFAHSDLNSMDSGPGSTLGASFCRQVALDLHCSE
jgi:hypothetical protein